MAEEAPTKRHKAALDALGDLPDGHSFCLTHPGQPVALPAERFVGKRLRCKDCQKFFETAAKRAKRREDAAKRTEAAVAAGCVQVAGRPGRERGGGGKKRGRPAAEGGPPRKTRGDASLHLSWSQHQAHRLYTFRSEAEARDWYRREVQCGGHDFCVAGRTRGTHADKGGRALKAGARVCGAFVSRTDYVCGSHGPPGAAAAHRLGCECRMSWTVRPRLEPCEDGTFAAGAVEVRVFGEHNDRCSEAAKKGEAWFAPDEGLVTWVKECVKLGWSTAKIREAYEQGEEHDFGAVTMRPPRPPVSGEPVPPAFRLDSRLVQRCRRSVRLGRLKEG